MREVSAQLRDVADQLGINKSGIFRCVLEHVIDNGTILDMLGGLENENE